MQPLGSKMRRAEYPCFAEALVRPRLPQLGQALTLEQLALLFSIRWIDNVSIALWINEFSGLRLSTPPKLFEELGEGTHIHPTLGHLIDPILDLILVGLKL
jgi:hypothetical protein